jgi:hypothetical protein
MFEAMKPERKNRRTTMVPVTTMEEVPLLSQKERAALISSLEEADARVKAGQGIEYDPSALKDRLLNIHRKAKRTKGL